MSDINLELGKSSIFHEDELKIDKKITFIFGKNGTGKSTLTSILEEQVKDHDVRSFKGFNAIVGEDNELNAVILGEENNEIDQKIKEFEEKKIKKEKEIYEIDKEILDSKSQPNNLWKQVNDSKQNYDTQKQKIRNFYIESAKSIKNQNNPQIAPTTYNKNNFKAEIFKAKLLSEEEIQENSEVIRSRVKEAKEINNRDIDLQTLLEETNLILAKKVTAKELITEIDKDAEKTQFAEMGLKLHKANEICSFCGNVISEERYSKLKKYFSADEVAGLRKDISNHISNLESKIQYVQSINMDLSEFYPQYMEAANNIKSEFDNKKKKVLFFLEELKVTSDNKLKELFQESEQLENEVPVSFKNELDEYNELVGKNNKSNLKEKQDKAKDEIRYDKIARHLHNFNYKVEKDELEDLEREYDKLKGKLHLKEEEKNNLTKDIKGIDEKITSLKAKTQNETILAQRINKKLQLYVNFELEYLAEEGKGYYRIKSKNTGTYRRITQLSTGEKNIIAFLYFIEKIYEIDNPRADLNKLIIFDDPMTSNDDNMQYLIIEELNSLIKRLSSQDKIIIMTHNNHFYLNLIYGYRCNNGYSKNIFLRMSSDGFKTKIVRLRSAEGDFKTNYDALWKELEFIYNEAPDASMLLNPIRRIIETFTKFNLINKTDMLSHVPGAAKLFNVNSHSIDDLEAELNGKDKKAIMKIMRKCFEEEHALEHFKGHCKIDLDE